MPHPARLVLPVALAAFLSACSSSGYSAQEEEKMIENHTELAQQYLVMGELDRAEGQVEKGLALDPGNVRLELIRAKVWIKRGRPEDMLRVEQRLAPIENQGDHQLRLCLGIALERKGVALDEAADAIESGKRVTESADPKQRVVELRGMAVESWRAALRRYERVLEERKEDTDAISGLIRVHGLLGNTEQSLAHAERLLAATQVDLDFWRKQILRPDMSASEESRFRSLVKQYETLQESTRITASILLKELGRDAQAEAHVTAAIELDPERAELYGRRAELRMAQRSYEAAIQDLDAFLRLSSVTLASEHPDVRRAWNLRRECEEALRTARAR